MSVLLIIFARFLRHSSLDSQNYYIAIWVERQVWFGETVQISLVLVSTELCLQSCTKINNSVSLINFLSGCGYSEQSNFLFRNISWPTLDKIDQFSILYFCMWHQKDIHKKWVKSGYILQRFTSQSFPTECLVYDNRQREMCISLGIQCKKYF